MITSEVTCATEVVASTLGKSLTPEELRDWIRDVPDDATLTPLMGDRGSQRDPDRYLRGMKAVWKRGL